MLRGLGYCYLPIQYFFALLRLAVLQPMHVYERGDYDTLDYYSERSIMGV
jgi:hypothetical protein